LISNQVVTPGKIARTAHLARRARIELCVDDAGNVAALQNAAAAAGAVIHVRVEINVGGDRCGVRPGPETVTLAKTVSACPDLAYTGLQAYSGRAQHLTDYADRRAEAARIAELVRSVAAALDRDGLAPSVIGGGGTGTLLEEPAGGIYTELQAGSYLFMDGGYAANRGIDSAPFASFAFSLFVLGTVVSATDADRFVCDVGSKACTFEAGSRPVFDRPDIKLLRTSDEHSVFLSPMARPAVGEQIRLIPANCDPAVALHQIFLVTQNGVVVDKWPILAR
jgi:3-hydroxy-D-aspartate aldolase